MNAQFTDWGTSLMTSLAGAVALLLAAVPRMLGFLVILGIGWLVAAGIERLLTALLHAVHFDAVAERAGLARMIRTVRREPSAVLGLIVKWFVRLIALVAAFDALGVPAVSQVFQQLVLWLPNLAVALVVLVVGGMAANALGDLVRRTAARSGIDGAEVLGSVARWSVWVFATLVAFHQIGIASALVTALFVAVVSAIALALGLSFGLGGRDTAGAIVRQFYDRNVRHGTATLEGAFRDQASSRVSYTGVEHRNGLGDRRRNPNGRRAIG